MALFVAPGLLKETSVASGLIMVGSSARWRAIEASGTSKQLFPLGQSFAGSDAAPPDSGPSCRNDEPHTRDRSRWGLATVSGER